MFLLFAVAPPSAAASVTGSPDVPDCRVAAPQSREGDQKRQKKIRYCLSGDNGFCILPGCYFKPLSPLDPVAGNTDDENNKADKGNKGEKRFHVHPIRIVALYSQCTLDVNTYLFIT